MNGHPPDIRHLLLSLSNPTSNDQYVRDQQILTNLFKEPEFFVALQAFALDPSLPQPARQLAAVITARELKTKWRSKQLVPEGRKPEIRERLLAFLEEEDAAIARPQLSLLVSVARIELPKQFQSLPQLLANPLLTCISQLSSGHAASSTTNTVLLNTIWTINALVKEFKSVKVAAGVQVMQTLEQAFAGPVGSLLQIASAKELHGGDDWVLSEAGRYAFKTLARFSQFHWNRAKMLNGQDSLGNLQGLVQHSVSQAHSIQGQRLRLISGGSQDANQHKLLRSLLKHLRAIGKWWRVMCGIDPKGFCTVEGVTSGIGWWWGEVGGVVAGGDGSVADDDSETNPYPKSFLLLGMLLFKDILPILSQAHPDIFTPSFVLNGLHLLVDRLLPLTSSDLEGLEDEPEEWLINEDMDEEAWQYDFRPAAERVLITLNNSCRHFDQSHKVIEPEILRIFHEAEAHSPSDLPTILRREAIYCSVGRLSRSLATFGGLDFNAFLQHTSSWLSQGIPLHRILKRRLAWLIGQWVSAEEECVKIPLMWQILLHLLEERSESSDMAVRLSAAVTLKECVDLWELDISYFLPYLEKTVHEQVKLLGEANTLSGKRYVNDALAVVIERVGDKILPFLPTLAQSIPPLWHGSGGLEGEWLFKASLVVLTAKLVSAAKETSGNLIELVIPLIEESLQSPAKEHFEDDGIELWEVALRNSTSLYQPSHERGLIRLLPGLLLSVGENMDTLACMLGLLNSYILLDAPGIMRSHGPALCEALMKALSASKINSDGPLTILPTVSLLVRLTSLPEIAPLLLQSGIFQYILTSLEDDKASGSNLAACLDVLMRMAITDGNVLLQMIAQSATIGGRDPAKVLEETLDAIWRNFDYVGEARQRKAVAMGAGMLLVTGNHHCLDRLDGEFMNIFLDVLGEVQGSSEDPSAIESAVRAWKDDHQVVWASIENTPEGARRSNLEDHDPAYAMPLKQFIIDTLHRASAVGMGPYWEKADEATKRSLEKFLS